MFNEDVINIMTSADDVLEHVGSDPFGMTGVLEISEKKLDKIDKYDLTNEQDVKKIRDNIKKMNNIKTALKVWSKLSKLVTVGGVVASATSAGKAVTGELDTSEAQSNIKLAAIVSLLSLVSSSVSKLISNAIAKGKEDELLYISKSLETNITQLQKKLDSAKGPARDAIEKQIQTAESFKNKVDAQLDAMSNSRADANTKAMNRIGSAGYANAAANLVR